MSRSGSSGDVYNETLAVFDQHEYTTKPLTTPEVADSLDVARRTVYKRLEKLVSRGDLKTKKAGANARVWWRSLDTPPDRTYPSADDQQNSEVESTVETVLERITDGFYGLDEQCRFTYINNRAEDFLDVEAATVLGRDIHEELVLTDTFEAALQEAYETQEPVRLEDYYEPLEAWFENIIYPSESGLSVYFQDISERKRLEHDLLVEEEHFRTALENSPLVAFRLDTELRYTWIANPHEDFDPDAVLGRRDDELLPSAAAETLLEPKRRALETGDRVREEVTYEIPSGIVSYDLSVAPLRDVTGEIVGLTAAFLDVTERKERERQLDAYRTILETVGDGVFTVDAANHFSIVNESYAGLLGYTTDELIGAHASRVASAEDYSAGKELKTELEAVGDVVQHELELETKAGDTIPVEVRFGLLPANEDEEHGVVAVVRDVAERKERERRLEESHQRYKMLVENFPNGGVGLIDEKFRYLVLGGEIFEELSIEELRGETVYDHLPQELLDVIEPKYRAAFDGESIDFEVEYGERIRQFRVLPVPDKNGKIHRIMAMSQDITERTQRERQLEEYRRQYRTLIENFPSGAVALVDTDFRYVAFGGSPEGDTDVTRADLEGKPVRDVLPPQIAEVVVPRYEAALDGEASAFEDTIDGRAYQFHFHPVRDDDGEVFAVTAVSKDITEQKRRETEIMALNRLNRVFQDITEAVIDSASREEIEQTITERLTNADSYEHAWIGHLDRRGENVVSQTAETNEDSPPEIPLSTETTESLGHRTMVEAIRTGAVQVSYDSLSDPVYEQWKQSEERTHEAVASIPITFEDRVYGVLTVYSGRENAFDENERRIIGRLGEVIGHAINSIEQKRALLEDRVTEVTFQSGALADAYTEAIGDGSFIISVDKSIVLSGGQTIAYYSLDGIEPDVYVDVVEKFYPESECHVLSQTGSTSRVEVRTIEATLASKLATYNSWIASGRFENEEFHITVHVPRITDVRTVTDVVNDVFPDTEVTAQTEIEREKPHLSDIFSDLAEQLTERQRTALETAYYSGFFDWPRGITGEELAERLDVTPATAHHHLRHGEHKLLAAFFGSLARSHA